MELLPLRKNTVALTTLALIAAIGIIVRVFVRIPLIFGVVELTPGFLFSLLGGVIGGLPGGILVGAITGLGGAMALAEPPLLPFIGNICLGIGSGYAIHLVLNRDTLRYYGLVIIGAPIIGGFIPTFLISALYGLTIELIVVSAITDMIQTLIWVIPALLIEKLVIRPIIGHYLYPDSVQLELDETEG
ncbi:MAG: hypothetical protein ACW98U_07940 [Candidatus Thorarchaeota archaeon]|jgi:hypothetical protein